MPLIYKGTIKRAINIDDRGLLKCLEHSLRGKNVIAELDAATWRIPDIFGWIYANSELNYVQFLNTFNCGIGMLLIVDQKDVTWRKIPGALCIGNFFF